MVLRDVRKLNDSSGGAQTARYLAPVSVENHNVGAPPPDGRRRYVYTRAVSLPNLAPGNM